MKSFKHLVIPALLSLGVCSCHAAQPVYRCGNSYSQTPCAGAAEVASRAAALAIRRSEEAGRFISFIPRVCLRRTMTDLHPACNLCFRVRQ